MGESHNSEAAGQVSERPQVDSMESERPGWFWTKVGTLEPDRRVRDLGPVDKVYKRTGDAARLGLDPEVLEITRDRARAVEARLSAALLIRAFSVAVGQN